VERLAEQPSASIPAACRGTAEIKAAYRLLSRDALGWDDILAPHLQHALERREMSSPIRITCTITCTSPSMTWSHACSSGVFS
jgi:hypothetical protein